MYVCMGVWLKIWFVIEIVVFDFVCCCCVVVVVDEEVNEFVYIYWFVVCVGWEWICCGFCEKWCFLMWWWCYLCFGDCVVFVGCYVFGYLKCNDVVCFVCCDWLVVKSCYCDVWCVGLFVWNVYWLCCEVIVIM